ncbi:MAG TPA: hypothetical protein VM493_05795, partial [Vicinamibacterales bacterium]|nr:hypothetical protein [Vicinamibacterales bacterium]
MDIGIKWISVRERTVLLPREVRLDSSTPFNQEGSTPHGTNPPAERHSSTMVIERFRQGRHRPD